jgi:hypothetical protein
MGVSMRGPAVPPRIGSARSGPPISFAPKTGPVASQELEPHAEGREPRAAADSAPTIVAARDVLAEAIEASGPPSAGDDVGAAVSMIRQVPPARLSVPPPLPPRSLRASSTPPPLPARASSTYPPAAARPAALEEACALVRVAHATLAELELTLQDIGRRLVTLQSGSVRPSAAVVADIAPPRPAASPPPPNASLAVGPMLSALWDGDRRRRKVAYAVLLSLALGLSLLVLLLTSLGRG